MYPLFLRASDYFMLLFQPRIYNLLVTKLYHRAVNVLDNHKDSVVWKTHCTCQHARCRRDNKLKICLLPIKTQEINLKKCRRLKVMKLEWEDGLWGKVMGRPGVNQDNQNTLVLENRPLEFASVPRVHGEYRSPMNIQWADESHSAKWMHLDIIQVFQG